VYGTLIFIIAFDRAEAIIGKYFRIFYIFKFRIFYIIKLLSLTLVSGNYWLPCLAALSENVRINYELDFTGLELSLCF
jgi:hypothetical protein